MSAGIEGLRESIRREVHAIHGIRDVHRGLVEAGTLLHLVGLLAENDEEITELANTFAGALDVATAALTEMGRVYHSRAIAERPAEATDGA